MIPSEDQALATFSAEIRRLIRHYHPRTQVLSIRYSGRLTRSYAYTRAEDEGIYLTLSNDFARRASGLGDDWRLWVREIARHEFAHILEWDRFGTIGHGPAFRTLARELGAYPRSWAEDSQRVAATRGARNGR